MVKLSSERPNSSFRISTAFAVMREEAFLASSVVASIDSAVNENEALSGTTDTVAEAETDTVGTILFSPVMDWQPVRASNRTDKTDSTIKVFLILFPP